VIIIAGINRLSNRREASIQMTAQLSGAPNSNPEGWAAPGPAAAGDGKRPLFMACAVGGIMLYIALMIWGHYS
jgi:hypothetical protein